jgi:DNA-binding transcriptional ArsR family regulator
MREYLTVVKALADENRVRILMFLDGGELCVCQIVELLDLAPSTVSKHMAILYQARLVESRKDGRWIYYRLAGKDASPSASSALVWLRSFVRRAPTIVADIKRVRAIRGMDRKVCADAVARNGTVGRATNRTSKRRTAGSR